MSYVKNTIDLLGDSLKHDRAITLPIFFFMAYMVFTYFPAIYPIFPFLGTIKSVLWTGVLFVVTYYFTRHEYRNYTVHENPIIKAWIGFLMIMLLGLITTRDRGLTLYHVKGISKHFLMFIIMIKVIDSPKRLNLIIGVFALCAIGMSLRSIVLEQVVEGNRAIAVQGGIFGDPNDLAFFLDCSLPFLFYFYIKSRRKMLPTIGIIIVITAILLTFSRGGFLGLCVIGFGLIFTFAREKRRYLIVILLGAILIWTLAPRGYKARIATMKTELISSGGFSIQGTRIATWIPNLKAGIKHPITGLGAGASYYVNGIYFNDWHSVHNSFVQAFVETGIIGGFCYCLLFFFPLKQLRRIVKKRMVLPDEDLLRLKIMVISFFSYATTAFFLPQAYNPILFLLTGIYLVQIELIRRRHRIILLNSDHQRK